MAANTISPRISISLVTPTQGPHDRFFIDQVRCPVQNPTACTFTCEFIASCPHRLDVQFSRLSVRNRGPGAAIHAAAPRYVSFLAFCAANVLMDIEPLYCIMTRQYPLHRFFHTYVGAGVVATSTAALFAVSRRAARAMRLSNSFDWQDLGMRAVAIG